MTKQEITHQIAKLEEDLYQARRTILDMVSTPYDEILSAYPDESVKYAQDWLKDVVEKVLAHVEETLHPGPKIVLVQHLSKIPGPVRLPCPLCRSTGLNPRSTGFAFPEGLMRHLLGEHNAAMCPVTQAAKALCNETLHSEFRFVGRRRD